MSRELFNLAHKKINQCKGEYTPYIVLEDNVHLGSIKEIGVVKGQPNLAWAKTQGDTTFFFEIRKLLSFHIPGDNEDEQETD